MAQSKGHSEHTKAADQTLGLAGEFHRPIKITLMGAGSGFTARLTNDFFLTPGTKGGEIALVDIDKERLETMQGIVTKLAAQAGAEGKWKISASTDRREVMAGSDYLVSCIEVSGLACVRLDNDIPLKYGVDQCIGDTIGPGGLFKALRTGPVLLEILRDAEALCPHAILLNYTNPMNALCLAAGRTSKVPVVGLCHSVQGTSHLLAERAGIDYSEMGWECAGINHLAWFTRLEHQGQDLYPLLKDKARADLERAVTEGRPNTTDKDPRDQTDVPEWQRDLVRKDMMLQFGAFITESSGHLSEYLPYYRKNAATLDRYCREGYDGGSKFYADNWPHWRQEADKDRAEMLTGAKPMDWPRSWEYASWIIEAREKDVPYRIHGNVMNNARGAGPLISNLPHDGCVEVACMIDRNGVTPTAYGKLPPQMAALCASNMAMFDLAADAIIHKSKEAAAHALMLDPLTAAVCSPAQARAMTEEMFAAEEKFLPGFR